MKKITISALAITALFFAACKKERTCSCSHTQTTTTVTTPQGGGTSTQETSSATSKSEQTIASVKKSEMRRFLNCSSGIQTSTSTQTTIAYVGSPVPQYVIADETETTVTDSSCEIK